MPLGALLGFLPGILGAGGIAAAAKGLGGGGGGIEKTAEQALTEQTKFGTETGKRLISKGETDLEAALNYWMPLLTGDRQAAMEAAGPDIKSILGLYDTAQRAVSELQPRGGARSTMMAELPFAKMGDITTLLQSLRKEAAGEVESIGTELGALGLGTMGGATTAAQSLLQAAITKRGQTMSTAAEVGVGIGKILATLLMKKGGK